MPRNNYYQDFGNPLRRAMLPARPLQTALPVKETNTAGRALIFRVFVGVIAIELASFLLRHVVNIPVANLALAAKIERDSRIVLE